MKEIILIKNGELALKGLNRMNFENALIKNIKSTLNGLGAVDITRAQSTITIEPLYDDYPFEQALDKIKKVFGIASFCRAAACEKDIFHHRMHAGPMVYIGNFPVIPQRLLQHKVIVHILLQRFQVSIHITPDPLLR